MFERIFRLRENETSVRREAIGGATTFFTLSYILFVQPSVLASCGMDHGAVVIATCVASAFATILMGLSANLPIALAPAMGHNFFFAFTVCGAAAIGGYGYPWTVGLGAVFVSGALFLILSLTGVRSAILNVFPPSLRVAIAVGIGLLITLVGLEYGGIVVGKPGTLIGLGDLGSPAAEAAWIGAAATLILLALRVRGAMLLGIVAAVLVGLLRGIFRFDGFVGFPRVEEPAFLRLDILGVFREPGFLTVLFVLLFLDLFDTIGTLLGVAESGGLLRDGRLPRDKQALLSDAAGTVAGALLGTSTITSYIESAAGIAEGARTGLASLFTAALLLLSLAFYPLLRAIGGGIDAGGTTLYPFIAPPLIVVGAIMLRAVRGLDWSDPTEYLPAFLPMVIIPFSFSISEGIGFGIIAYSALKIVTGRAREAHAVLHLLAALFLLRYLFLR
ncbi:MAG: NCS2 family permease [Candidatus Eisenbacteria bacterium]|nr:NCS2 family permease [Candidatus Eisenbacteria bacterium]